MSIERARLHERESLSPSAIPLRYSMDRLPPVIEARVVPDSRFGKVPGVSRYQHAGEFLWALLTGALALALVTPGV
jgi:hypothetical protein